MNKTNKLAKELRKQNDFYRAYLGEEDIWILVNGIEDNTVVDVTRKYMSFARNIARDKNILLIDKNEEKDLLEDIDTKDYKVIYKGD